MRKLIALLALVSALTALGACTGSELCDYPRFQHLCPIVDPYDPNPQP
jgi:hypothetical protein